MEHLRSHPPARRYLLTGNFSRPTWDWRAAGDYIGQGIHRLGLQDAFPAPRAPPTYAPPYPDVRPVRWDYVLASRALAMTGARMLPAIPEIRTASGALDGAAMRDAMLLATGCTHAPIGVELGHAMLPLVLVGRRCSGTRARVRDAIHDVSISDATTAPHRAPDV